VEIERGLTGPEPELILFSRFQYDPSNPDRFWRIMAAEPSAIAYAPIDALNRRLVYLVIAVAAVACFIGWIAAYGVVKPIRAMVATAQRITDGDLDAAVDVSGSGEVSLLGTAFNTMTRRLNSLIRDEQLARMNLAQSNEELRRSNEELEQFAFAASHDLRTPLRAISALREWIATDLAATKSISEDVQEHLEGMGKQVDRMSRLLSDLLEYARIGKSDVKVRRFDPAEAVHHTLALLQVPPTFTVDVAFERRTISGAPVEFELVVRNLVDNAVKHHDRSTGTIRVSGTYRREKFILEVADDGPGIPTAYHERVLRPFSVLRPRDDCEGSGLGLALVNKIVQRWGGSLEIRSADGKRGTTFRITMPIAQLKIVQTDDGAAPVPPPARRAESVAG
ncbi:MAG: sensor histidine kinase, partial [Candidatus Eiseniibacteriota bacterium]